MRTNPFLDAWMFLIGATDDHDALGLFKYALVLLFIALLVASAWIAMTNWREDPVQRAGVHVATFACRVLIGSMWFQGCLWKLPLPVSGGFQYWTGQMVDNAAFEFHRALVKSVYLPYLHFIDPVVFLAEISFATSLLLGFVVRFFAFLAIFFSLHLWVGLRGGAACSAPWAKLPQQIQKLSGTICCSAKRPNPKAGRSSNGEPNSTAIIITPSSVILLKGYAHALKGPRATEEEGCDMTCMSVAPKYPRIWRHVRRGL